MAASITGKHFAKAVVEFQGNGQSGAPYVKYEFGEVIFTSYEAIAGGQQEEWFEMFTTTVAYTYRPIGPDGEVGAPISMSWNLKTNQVVAPPLIP